MAKINRFYTKLKTRGYVQDPPVQVKINRSRREHGGRELGERAPSLTANHTTEIQSACEYDDQGCHSYYTDLENLSMWHFPQTHLSAYAFVKFNS